MPLTFILAGVGTCVKCLNLEEPSWRGSPIADFRALEVLPFLLSDFLFLL